MQKAIEPENDAGFPKHNYSQLNCSCYSYPSKPRLKCFFRLHIYGISKWLHTTATARVKARAPYQLKMAAPAEVSKKRSNFLIRQFYEKRHFNIAANLTLNTMVSFIILFNCAYCQNSVSGQTDRMTDRQNDKPSTVTLAAHARRGLIIIATYGQPLTVNVV